MNERIESVRQWVIKRTSREQLYLFICGFGLIYLIFYIFFYRPLSRQNVDIENQIKNLETQKASIEQQIDTVSHATQDPMFVQMLQEANRLQNNVSRVQAKLQKLKPRVVQAIDTTVMIADIIKVASNNIEFVKLDELPVVLWLTTDTEKSALKGIASEDLYAHAFQIEFMSDYFNTIQFIKNIEKLKWPIYWDSLDYKVSAYPKADVTIKFHVLSIQKS